MFDNKDHHQDDIQKSKKLKQKENEEPDAYEWKLNLNM